MSAILNAISQGFRSSSILNRLSKISPKYADAIYTARQAGYLTNSILRKLDKHGKDYEDSDYLTAWEKGRKADEENKRKAKRQLGTAVGALGAAGAIGAGLINAANQPQQTNTSNSVLPNAPGGTINATASPIKPPITPGAQEAASKLPEALHKEPESLIKAETPIASSIKSQYPQLDQFIDKSLESGKSAEETYENLKKSRLLSPVVHRIEQKEGNSLLEDIKQRSSPSKIESPKMGESFITPSGAIGSLTHAKGDKSIVDVGGKRESFSNDQLQPIPKSWENVQIDLNKIPEVDRSSNLNFVAPTEDKKMLAVRFWNKKQPIIYLYQKKSGDEFEDDLLQSLAEETDSPITSGENFFGSWDQSGKSRGSAFFHKMKMMSQSASEPDDPNKPYIFFRAPLSFEHGYMKTFESQLHKFSEEFDIAHGKRKRSKKS